MVIANDFFCGCGGMGLGFKQSGFRLGGAWDVDKYAVQSYGENISPKVKQLDIRQMNWNDVPQADVWTFGFPCQDLSVAGKQKGLYEGERSGLFFQVMRLLQETRENKIDQLPKVIMAENVKGLKPYLDVLAGEYAMQGYMMYCTLFNSKYWGVPQNRERYFVVGIREDLPQTFAFPVQQTDFVPKLSSILETVVDEKYYIDDEKATKIIQQAMNRLDKLGNVHATITPDRVDKQQNGRRAKAEEEEMFTLTAQDLHGVICINPRKKDGTQTYQQDRVYHPDGVMTTVSATLSGRTNIVEPKINVIGRLDMKGLDVIKRVYDAEGLSPTLTTSEGGHRQPKILVEQIAEETGLLHEDGVGKTLRISGKCSIDKKHNYEHVLTPQYRVRKLTPREYARLQGFPDTYKLVCSNSQVYKQFGNAVTVNVAQAIAEQIKQYLETL